MSFFKNKLFKKNDLVTPVDLSLLGCDIHSHFIPGIDDGAQTLEDSIQLIQTFANWGYKKVITTPHVMADSYKNTPEIILAGLTTVKKALKEHNITIEIEAAAEYYIDELLEQKIKNREILSFGKNYVLFEMPFIAEPASLYHIIFNLQLQGYTPVLAHAERYSFWHNTYNKILDCVDKGVLIQVNIASFTGHYGPQVKTVAEKLASDNIIHLLGSDCHHTGHLQLIESARKNKFIKKLIENNALLNNTL